MPRSNHIYITRPAWVASPVTAAASKTLDAMSAADLWAVWSQHSIITTEVVVPGYQPPSTIGRRGRYGGTVRIPGGPYVPAKNTTVAHQPTEAELGYIRSLLVQRGYADQVAQLEAVRAANAANDSGLFGGLGSVVASIVTAPVRAANGAVNAALTGGSIKGAVEDTRIGNTSLLKVGQVAGAAAAVYFTAGAAGGALAGSGIVGAAGSAGAAAAAGMGTAAAEGMALSSGMQLATRGYISPTAMARAGVAGAVAQGVKALSLASDLKPALDAYKADKSVKNLKAAYDKYQAAKAAGQLEAQQRAELARLEADIAALNQAQAAQVQVAAAQPVAQAAGGAGSGMTWAAGGLIALKLISIM